MLIDEIEALMGDAFPYKAATDLRFVLAFSFLVAVAATRDPPPPEPILETPL